MTKRIIPILLVALTLLVSTVPVMAAENDIYNYNGVDLPYYDLLNDEDYHYAIMFNSSKQNKWVMYLSSVPFRIEGDGTLKTLHSGYGVHCTLGHVYNDPSAPWEVLKAPITSDEYLGGHTSSDIKWSSHDIYDNANSGTLWVSGDRNFRLALPMEVAVEELKMVTVPQMMETISTLVLCGVGLMALLVLLAMLYSVLHRFLPN